MMALGFQRMRWPAPSTMDVTPLSATMYLRQEHDGLPRPLARSEGYSMRPLFKPDQKLSEGDEQLLLFRWIRKQSLTVPELAMAFHVPNGGARDGRTAARLKLEGVTPGVPDICLPIPAHQADGTLKYGLWIELKKRGGHTTMEQDVWLRRLNSQGYAANVAYGAEQARQQIIDYLGLGDWLQLLTLDLASCHPENGQEQG